MAFVYHLHWLIVRLGIKLEESVFPRTSIAQFHYLWTSVSTCVRCAPLLTLEHEKSQSCFCIDFVVAIYLAHIRWVFFIILFLFFSRLESCICIFLLWILHTNNELCDTFPVLWTFPLVHPYLSLLHVNVHFIYTVLLLVFDFYIAVVSSQLGAFSLKTSNEPVSMPSSKKNHWLNGTELSHHLNELPPLVLMHRCEKI